VSGWKEMFFDFILGKCQEFKPPRLFKVFFAYIKNESTARGGKMNYYEGSHYWREQLRLSRRVLMNLIEKLERDRNNSLLRLEEENRRLHLLNHRYVRCLQQKNRQIKDLELKIAPSTKNCIS
jgi:hypothetical protein